MTNMLAAAEIIATARRNRTPLEPLAADVAPQDEAEGYRIQRALHELLSAEFGALVGYKIGCTSAVMQQYLGIPHPCGGGVFAKGVHASGASLRARDFVRVGVECEIAVRLGARSCRRSQAPFTAEYGRASHRGLSAGDRDRRRPLRRLANHRRADVGGGRFLCRRLRARQTGGAIRRARSAATWSAAPSSTASKSAAAPAPTCSAIRTTRWRGSPTISPPTARALRAGQIVLTGSLVKTVWLNAGDSVTMDLSGLGSVSATFA